MLYVLLAPLLLLPVFWWDRRRKRNWLLRARQEREAAEAAAARAEARQADDLLAQLTAELALSQDVAATAEAALNCLARWVEHRQVCIYDEQLRPLYWRGAEQAPAVPAAIEQELTLWRSWMKLKGSEQALTGRIMRGAVAVWPLEREGALLVDLTGHAPLNAEQELLVTLVASLTALGMQSARRLRAQQQAQERMLRASKLAAMGQLAAGVAHELNTPLAAAMLQIDLLQLQPLPAPALQALENAQSSIEQAQKIIERLLLYSRRGDGGVETVDLNEILRDTLQLLHSQLQVDGVEVTTEWGPELPAQVNANELQQVFTYLLLHCKNSGPLLLRTGCSGSEVSVEILDRGPLAEDSSGFELHAVRALLERQGGRLEQQPAGSPWARAFRVHLPRR